MERKMRLIDPEVFEKEIQRYADAEETQSIINTGGSIMSFEHRQVLQAITALKAAFKTIMDYMPTVDAVEVVRCQNCQHYREDLPGSHFGYCYHWDHEQGMSPNQVEHDDFCSYGEKREVE